MTTGRGPGPRGPRRNLHSVGPEGSRTVGAQGVWAPGPDSPPRSPSGGAPAASTTPVGEGAPRPGGPQPDWERSRTHAEGFVVEDEVLADARARSADHDVVAMGSGAAAALTFLATATGARTVVEIGTGLGVGTVSLLRGMPADGVLTSIDVASEYQRLARLACTDAGFAPGRVRMITGRALDVLPRLSDAGYDMVVVDAVTTEYPRYLTEAVRLLRPGGVVALDDALWNGRVADPVRRDAVSVALRETGRMVREDEDLVPVMLPLSDGLLCAALRR